MHWQGQGRRGGGTSEAAAAAAVALKKPRGGEMPKKCAWLEYDSRDYFFFLPHNASEELGEQLGYINQLICILFPQLMLCH